MTDSTDPRLPNIVLILADNLGWGELGCYGGGMLRGAPTPRIDKLASEGLRFLNFNVESDCVPTRSALMTGRHPIRTGALQSIPAGLPQGIIPWEVTVAQLLSARGYATAIYGKWHLGHEVHPQRGFEGRPGPEVGDHPFQRVGRALERLAVAPVERFLGLAHEPGRALHEQLDDLGQ